MNADEIDDITERVIGSAFTVSNTLGCGFLEKVYENALAPELRAAGMTVEQQSPIAVHYRERCIGEFTADALVERSVVVELKATDGLSDAHTGQCINYLAATGLKVCLLLNFGKPRLEVKRVARDL